jgi:hypothetical protein
MKANEEKNFQKGEVAKGKQENISDPHFLPASSASVSLIRNTEAVVARLALGPQQRTQSAKGGSM